MKVVVLGGYGNFGARICRALAGDAAIDLIVAARDLLRAEKLAQEIGAKAAMVDVGAGDLAQRLRALGAGLVIHTAGPFQDQGYAVAHACAQAGSHYVDLADGRRFVCDFAQALDATYRAAGRCAVTGASTVPALSSAVVDALARRFAALESIDYCIAPAQQAPRGVATIAGVLSYCGVPVQVWREGRWQPLAGWANPEPIRFARLKTRLGALCDIPDLELFPQRYPAVRDVMFRAALEVGASQRAFGALAWMRQRGLVKNPERFAAFMHSVGGVFDPFGTPDGGMVVRVRGRDTGGLVRQWAWHLTAPDHHGPEIPCMAAVLLARRIARGKPPPSGAHACMGLIRLEDFAPEFARWRITTEIAEEAAP